MQQLDLIRRFVESGQRAQAAINFVVARSELGRLGIILEKRAGEYSLSLKGRPDVSRATVETLDEAISVGIDLAKIHKPLEAKPPLGPTPRGSRRGQMFRHNRKLAARRARKHKRTER